MDDALYISTASTGPPFITADRPRLNHNLPPERVASTGPPFITADRPLRRRILCSEESRFNGAAVHHGGSHAVRVVPNAGQVLLQRGRRSSRRIASLTYPTPTLLATLQRGRRSSRRIAAVSERDAGVIAPASTGPPFITADRITKRTPIPFVRNELQRGRRSSRRIAAKTSCLKYMITKLQRGRRSSRRIACLPATAFPVCIPKLQRGRRSSRRIAPSGSSATAPRPAFASTGPPFITADRPFRCGPLRSAIRARFNGAAVHHGGSPGNLARGALARVVRASTGPPFITADRRTELVDQGRETLASTGPPFITADRSPWRAGRPRRPWPCFNGAAVHHGGSHDMSLPIFCGQCELQRGRRSSRRIASVSHSERARIGRASTGPPFITADRMMSSA